MEVIKLVNGYDRKKKEILTFRNPVNVAEMILHCREHEYGHIWFKTMQGDAGRAKVNGRVKTWKRDPGRVEVPIKYGLYEYGTFTQHDLERVLIPVAESGANE